MNEKLIEIFEMAGISDSIKQEFDIQYLANLIIQECSKLVQLQHNNSQLFTNEAYNRGYLDGRNDAEFMIKQYFGIE